MMRRGLAWQSVAMAGSLTFAVIAAMTMLPMIGWRNFGSLSYFQAPMTPSRLPNAAHERHTYWQAVIALAAGDADKAWAILMPQATIGDRVTRHLASWAAFRANDTATAVALWMENSDTRSINQAIAEYTGAGSPANTYALYRALDQMDPKDAAAGYARFLAAQGSVDQAVDLLAEMVHNHPAALQRSNWLRAWAEILRKAERWEEAAATLNLLAAEPGQAGSALTELGQMYDARGAPDAALAVLRQATQQEPGYALAYATAAAILARTGAYADAGRWYADALARQPERSDWALAQAQVSAAAGDMRDALRLYAAAVQRYPADARFQYEAAQYFLQSGELSAARDAILQAIAAAPTPRAAYHRLAAQIFTALGDTVTANQHEQMARQSP